MLILIAFATPLIIGGLAAGVETGIWYLAKRQAQQQADVSALAAARAKAGGINDFTTLSAVATRDAVRNGFVNVSPNAVVIGNPPTSGAFTGISNTVQATVTVRVPLTFSKYFMGSTNISVTARAVAGTETISSGGTSGCVMALDSSASNAIHLNGNVSANLAGCTIVSNSNNSSAVKFNGNVNVSANSIYTRGGVQQNGNVTVTLTSPQQTNQSSATTDPHAGSSIPAFGTCNHTGYSLSGNGTTNMTAGVYCGGISIAGNRTVNMAPGTYYINKGNFSMSANASLSCSTCTGTNGVTIVLTSDDGTGIGSMSVSGNAVIDLKAPSGTSDPFRGYVVYQDRRATTGNGFSLTGNGNMRLTGAIYAPSAAINFSGNASLPSGRKCVQLIGRTVQFSGNANLDVSECSNYGVTQITAGGSSYQLRLLE